MDGTLTLTEDVGDSCWARAVEATLGIDGPDTEWTHYRDVTDLGVTQEVCRRRLRREPRPAEVEAMRRRYVACIRRGARERPGLFRLVPGVHAMLAGLPRAGWHVALATGAWRACFLAKTQAAGLRFGGLPVATADDDGRRVGIVRAAVAAAARAAGVPRFGRVVAVGDGVWDVRAARALRCGFVGVTASGGSSKMRAEGARAFVRDYRDLPAFLRRLERAGPPVPARLARA